MRFARGPGRAAGSMSCWAFWTRLERNMLGGGRRCDYGDLVFVVEAVVGTGEQGQLIAGMLDGKKVTLRLHLLLRLCHCW